MLAFFFQKEGKSRRALRTLLQEEAEGSFLEKMKTQTDLEGLGNVTVTFLKTQYESVLPQVNSAQSVRPLIHLVQGSPNYVPQVRSGTLLNASPV